jgi:hypothetical protein
MFRNRTTLFLGILAAAVVSFGTTSTDTQEPDGQPDIAAIGTQMETQYAGVPSYSVMRTPSRARDDAVRVAPGNLRPYCPETRMLVLRLRGRLVEAAAASTSGWLRERPLSLGPASIRTRHAGSQQNGNRAILND